MGANESAFEPRAERGGDLEVINPPTNVPLAHTPQGTPPGVMAAAFLKFAEGVQKARFDEGAETRPLLGREPMVAQVGFGMGKVQFGVGDIEIAAKDRRLPPRQLLDVAEEFAVPLLAVGQAG